MSVLGLSSLNFGINRLANHQADISQSLERLSTGKRINRASDDPSGLVASNKLQASKLSIERRLSSFQRESTMLGAQEGALSVLADLTIELDALVVKSANTAGLSQEEQDANRDEIQSLLTAIDFTSSTATFNGTNLLTGFTAAQLTSIDYQTDDLENIDPVTGEPGKKTVTATLADLPQLLESNPELAQELAQSAAAKVNARRGAIGNRINSIDSQSRALVSELTNTADALSLIEDADYAKETAKLVRAQILEQATIITMQTQRQQVESMLGLLTNSTSAISASAPTSSRIA